MHSLANISHFVLTISVNQNLMDWLSVVSTVVGIVFPVGALLKVGFKLAFNAMVKHIRQPDEEQSRQIKSLEMSVSEIKQKVQELDTKEDGIEVKIAEIEAQINILLNQNIRKKDY